MVICPLSFVSAEARERKELHMMPDLIPETRTPGQGTEPRLDSSLPAPAAAPKEPLAGSAPMGETRHERVLRRRGRVCLRKAKKAVRETCTTLGAEAREELVSALMPALWRRVRYWRRGDKSFREFAEQSAFHSLKDYLRRLRTSRDALDRAAVGLEEFGDGI